MFINNCLIEIETPRREFERQRKLKQARGRETSLQACVQPGQKKDAISSTTTAPTDMRPRRTAASIIEHKLRNENKRCTKCTNAQITSDWRFRLCSCFMQALNDRIRIFYIATVFCKNFK